MSYVGLRGTCYGAEGYRGRTHRRADFENHAISNSRRVGFRLILATPDFGDRFATPVNETYEAIAQILATTDVCPACDGHGYRQPYPDEDFRPACGLCLGLGRVPRTVYPT